MERVGGWGGVRQSSLTDTVVVVWCYSCSVIDNFDGFESIVLKSDVFSREGEFQH